MEDSYKEVYFSDYCKKCVYKDSYEDDEPCYECLDEPVNVYSHKPVKFEEKQVTRVVGWKKGGENK